MPRFLYPLLPYRSFAIPILILSAITVPCWLLFRLYRVRSTGHRVSYLREVLLLIVVLYLSGLAAVTLIPSHPSREAAKSAAGVQLHPDRASLTCSSSTLRRGSTAQSFCVRNARGNVLLFFPLGILLPLVFKRLRFWSALQIAFALSVSIELVQYLSRAFGSARTADINDVILNGFGACLGLALVFLLRQRREAPPAALRA